MRFVKFLFYSAVLLVTFYFNNSFIAHAVETDYSSDPEMPLLSTKPVLYSATDFNYCTDGLFDSGVGYTLTGNDAANLKYLNDCSLTSGNYALPYSTSAFINVDLDKPQNIKAIFTSVKTGSNFVRFDFYDSNKTLIKRVYGSKSGEGQIYTYVDVKNVSNIKAFSNDGLMYLSEMDFVTEPVYSAVTNINAIATKDTVSLTWINPKSTDLDHILVDGVDVAKSTSHVIKNLESNKTYKKDIVAVYKDGTQIIASVSFTTEEATDKEPPKNVSSISVNPGIDFMELSYTLPVDDDFSHVDIYRDGKYLSKSTESTYMDINLVQDTVYTYKVVSVDEAGNQSVGQTISGKTLFVKDNTPPVAVTDLKVKSLNGGGRLYWTMNVENDIDGYEVYLNGVKKNTTLVKSNTFQLSDLKNGESYEVYIIAFDKSGNKSVKSNIVNFKPDQTQVPPVNIGGGSSSNGDHDGYSLKDISDGTSNWFGSLWLLLAFAIAIPIAFIIGRRIKGLFIS